MNDVREAQHSEPAWRDRSDFIIAADISAHTELAYCEQLWAKRVGDETFELCCIPFFVYDIALGDVVATSPSGDRKYMISNVVQPSGRFVYRVWFGQTAHPRDEVASELVDLGRCSNGRRPTSWR